MTSIDVPEQQEFVTAFLAVHRSLYAYVVSLTPQISDAEEVFQKTSLVLWQRWQDYDQSKDFLTWAFGVARIQVRNHLSSRGRAREILGDQAAMAIEEAMARSESRVDDRLNALKNCMKKLPVKQRKLLEVCYVGRAKDSLQQVALEMRLTANALYQQLKRLRQVLHDCVEDSLRAEEAT